MLKMKQWDLAYYYGIGKTWARTLMLTTIVQRTIPRIKFSRRFRLEHFRRAAAVVGERLRRGVNRFIAVFQRRNYCSGFPFGWYTTLYTRRVLLKPARPKTGICNLVYTYISQSVFIRFFFVLFLFFFSLRRYLPKKNNDI